MRTFVLSCLLLSATAGISPAADTLTFEQLVEAGRVRMKVRLLPGAEVLVSQKVTLQIEISTDRWFLGGTRIDELEIKNVIVPRRSGFAVNSTRKEKGVTWTIQQWDLEMYPRKEGTVSVPALEVQLTVSGDDNQPVKGSFFTKPITFKTTIPEELKQTETWFAGNDVSLKEGWDKTFESLKAGDAITRTVMMEATGVPAMILPGFVAEPTDGMAVYPKSPDIEDKTARGESRAIRKDEVTYFFEQPGTYTLPEQQFIWWNLAKSKIETLTLKEQIIEVAAATSGAEQGAKSASKESGKPFPFRKILAISGLLLLLIWIASRVKNSPYTEKIMCQFKAWHDRPPSEKDYWKKCTTTAGSERAEDFLASLYAWLDHGIQDPEINTLESFARHYGDPELESTLRDLNRTVSLPGSSKNLDTIRCLKSLSKARNKWRRNSTKTAKAVQLLNP